MDTNVITVEVQKLDLKPGDILALRVDRSLDKTQEGGNTGQCVPTANYQVAQHNDYTGG